MHKRLFILMAGGFFPAVVFSQVQIIETTPNDLKCSQPEKTFTINCDKKKSAVLHRDISPFVSAEVIDQLLKQAQKKPSAESAGSNSLLIEENECISKNSEEKQQESVSGLESSGPNQIPANSDDDKRIYIQAFNEQNKMLKGAADLDFSKSVFISENAYVGGKMSYLNFKNQIQNIRLQLNNFIAKNEIATWKMASNYAVFKYVTAGFLMNKNKSDRSNLDQLRKNMVSEVLKNQEGNSKALSYLYKILCNSMGASAYLAMAPNCTYIKHEREKGGWSNINLISASFPTNRMMKRKNGVTDKAIKYGLYMTAMSERESVALTMYDLANYYKVQHGMDSFYFKVISTALSYHPNCVPILLSKAEYLKECNMMTEFNMLMIKLRENGYED